MPQRRAGWVFLAAWYLCAPMDGIRSAALNESPLDLLVPLAITLPLAWWAIGDSRARGQPIPLLSRQWFLLAGTALVPAYVVWSRGWRGVGLVLLNAIAWLLLWFTGAVFGFLVYEFF